MSARQKWADLGPRIVSAIVLLGVGAVEVYLGGLAFEIFIWVAVTLMLWELLRMCGAKSDGAAMRGALLGGAVLAAVTFAPAMLVVPLLGAAALVCATMVGPRKDIVAGYGFAVLLAGLGFIVLRNNIGLMGMAWLIGVVVASDVAGYFAGRLLGGPKFWPAVSPKKTWSGTIAGWVCAGLVGLAFMGALDASILIVPASILMALAAQFGDIAESAIKRVAGVKDSSNLIPGHGGVLDRFDGMIGAVLIAWPAWSFGIMSGVVL